MYWERKTKHHTPHFHAIYNEYECIFRLPDLTILSGKLSKRAERMVKTWAKLNKEELMENWNRIQMDQPLKKIKPLE